MGNLIIIPQVVVKWIPGNIGIYKSEENEYENV